MELLVAGRAIRATSRAAYGRERHVLDALARLQSDGVMSLEELLRPPLARNLGGGLRVIITTDLGLAMADPGEIDRRTSRLIVLQTSGFGGDAAACP